MILQVGGFRRDTLFLEDNLFIKKECVIDRVVQGEVVEEMECDRCGLRN